MNRATGRLRVSYTELLINGLDENYAIKMISAELLSNKCKNEVTRKLHVLIAW